MKNEKYGKYGKIKNHSLSVVREELYYRLHWLQYPVEVVKLPKKVSSRLYKNKKRWLENPRSLYHQIWG